MDLIPNGTAHPYGEMSREGPRKGQGLHGLEKEEGVRDCWVSLGRYLARYGRDIEKGLYARFKASSRRDRSRTLNRLGVIIRIPPAW